MRKQTKLVAVLSAAALLAIGASMTSYAAGGWVAEGDNDWVYLDNDGERITNEWRRSGDNYYYLDEDGLMAKSCLIFDDTADAIYYVNENGVKVTNDWVKLENTEGEQVGDDTPTVLYYHFGSAGKADRADNDTDLKVKNIDGKYYVFDRDGHMLSGWQQVTITSGGVDREEIYYLGTENEGFAYIGWQKLEPDQKLVDEDYDELKWFYFDSNGRAVKDTTKYIDKRYYSFDQYGVMRSDWYDVSNPVDPSEAGGAVAFASASGSLSSGWVLTTAPDEGDGEEFWYYLVSVRDGSNVVRSVPFNYFGNSINYTDNTVSIGDTDYYIPEIGEMGFRTKIIKNKTYIFNAQGQMLTGFVYADDKSGVEPAGASSTTVDEMLRRVPDSNRIPSDQRMLEKDNLYAGITGSRTLTPGLYYFNESASGEGQMQTGRVAITEDGDTFYYYFNKDTNSVDYGSALVNAVKDGYLYGTDGKCVVAEDGNTYQLYNTPNDAPIRLIDKAKVDGNYQEINVDGNTAVSVIVSRTGKIKQSGSVTIDGVKYTIKDYAVTETKIID